MNDPVEGQDAPRPVAEAAASAKVDDPTSARASAPGPPPAPPRQSRLIPGLLALAALAAGGTLLMSHLNDWEERRQLMYAQRDATKVLCEEAQLDLDAAGRTAGELRVVGGQDGRTADWRITLEAWETQDDQRTPLIRAVVSGENDRLALELAPIRVETYGSALDEVWLDRVRKYYDAREWRYEVVQLPPASAPNPPPL